jgi:hypothetical protein
VADDVAGLAAQALSIARQATETQEKIVIQQGKSRRNIRLIAVSVALDVALSVSLIFLAVGQASVSDQIHRSQVTACGIGNGNRAAQIRLWDHVIAISKAPPGETAAQRTARLAKLAAFRAYVRTTFHPVDCTALYGK